VLGRKGGLFVKKLKTEYHADTFPDEIMKVTAILEREKLPLKLSPRFLINQKFDLTVRRNQKEWRLDFDGRNPCLKIMV